MLGKASLMFVVEAFNFWHVISSNLKDDFDVYEQVFLCNLSGSKLMVFVFVPPVGRGSKIRSTYPQRVVGGV